MVKKTVVLLVVIGVIMGVCTAIFSENKDEKRINSAQYSQGKFHNSVHFDSMSLTKMPAILARYITEKRVDVEPKKAIPLQKITSEILAALPDDQMTVFRLGHSSFLLKANGKYWLIDPVFSERASPFSFIGPKRFHQPPITIESLPNIEGVILSHNHYDHLDKSATKALANKVNRFLVPLGVGNELLDWGVDQSQILEFDWWESTIISGIEFTFAPTQHFSGRGLTDGNETLWGSWAIKDSRADDQKNRQENSQIDDHQSIFYSGDSGYFAGFKEIGERLGPFDLTIIETGAYDKDWPDVHMTPEQSLQTHIDVGGKKMLPAHNGTFDLAFHAWYEPLVKITELAQNNNVDLITPIVGEPVNIKTSQSNIAWWEGLNE